MGLRTVSVSQCLDKRLIVFGFEVLDLIAIFITLSTLNLLFGNTELKLPLVWIPALSLASVLRFGKKGKPDQFLAHWLRFQLSPGVYSAFEPATGWVAPPTSRDRMKRGAHQSRDALLRTGLGKNERGVA